MPNWCWTNIIFHGHKNELQDLRSHIEKWTSENLELNGFGTNWLGNIVYGAGLGDRIDNGQNNRIRCRGSLVYMSEVLVYTDEDSELMIRTETAWTPMVRMWDEIFNIMGYKTIGFSFQSEEESMSEFLVYDPYGDFEDNRYEQVDKSDVY